jgi:hypothetical protein
MVAIEDKQAPNGRGKTFDALYMRVMCIDAVKTAYSIYFDEYEQETERNICRTCTETGKEKDRERKKESERKKER